MSRDLLNEIPGPDVREHLKMTSRARKNVKSNRYVKMASNAALNVNDSWSGTLDFGLTSACAGRAMCVLGMSHRPKYSH
jgi:hypothetical protein